MPANRANINPDLLTFSRERMGYDIPVISKSLQINEERWINWERGEEKPTMNQLIRIAEKLDRTPAFFYLNEPPVEKEPLAEFRTLRNVIPGSVSPKLISAIRAARRNRETLIELYDEQNKSPKPAPALDWKAGSIAEQARYIREWLGITVDKQSSWTSSSEALTNWKGLLEDQDIYVVQFPYVQVDECRGFAIAEEQFPVIGINSKDTYNARIFTLIHELAHVFYRDTVLTNDRLSDYFDCSRSMEKRCNRLAAEILVPSNDLKNMYRSSDDPEREIRRLANTFRVSGYVMLIRLNDNKLMPDDQFEFLLPEFSFYDGTPGGSDGGNSYYNQIVRKGRLYMKAAFQSYFDNRITVAELAQLTGWKVPNLNELAAKTFHWPEEGHYV
ncbi:MAG: ImmA/IrrE family metallo-endopeptidase [Balneolaceae bacterium]|nr:MAG: ImmA/IrrE family metallo-endopeptidase [Balneolaceae bacterium]